MQTLQTARLLIRSFLPEDLEDAHRLLDVDLHWSGSAVSLEQRRQRLQFYRDLADWADTRRLYGYRAVVLRATSRLLGICGFLPCLWPPRRKALLGMDHPDAGFATLELELGYALASDGRGQGYATEAVRARLKPSGYYLISTAMYDPARVYEGDYIFDHQTGICYEAAEEGAVCDGATSIGGKAYWPHRRHLRPEALARALKAVGFRVLWQGGALGGDLVCVRDDQPT